MMFLEVEPVETGRWLVRYGRYEWYERFDVSGG